jgi:conjugal transfer pilus assembly protein TraF
VLFFGTFRAIRRAARRRTMPRMRPVVLVLVCLAVLPSAAAALSGFYLRSEEGWFWYEREPEPQEEPEPAPPLPPPASTPTPSETPSGAPPLSSAWLRERLGAYRDQAIDDPTPDNVALYLYLQRVAMDKASRFAAATQRAVQFDPFLDEITQRPTANFAANLVNEQTARQRAALLAQIAQEAGVLFFFRSDCPYCEAQAPLLATLHQRHGFAVLPVSIDGAPLPGDQFPNFQRDAGQAQALGVVSTPALFLARPPDGVALIAQGLLSLSQLEERLLTAALEAGWISEAEYAKSRPVVADLRLDPRGLDLPRTDRPDDLLAALRAAGRALAE